MEEADVRFPERAEKSPSQPRRTRERTGDSQRGGGWGAEQKGEGRKYTLVAAEQPRGRRDGPYPCGSRVWCQMGLRVVGGITSYIA